MFCVMSPRTRRRVLGAEDRLTRDGDGRGWATDLVSGLRVDAVGQISNTCMPEDREENDLAPADHHVSVVLTHVPGGGVRLTFDNGDAPPQRFTAPCSEDLCPGHVLLATPQPLAWARHDRPDRARFARAGIIKTVDQARHLLHRELPGRSPSCAQAAHRVARSRRPCRLRQTGPQRRGTLPGGREGFDVHLPRGRRRWSAGRGGLHGG